MLIFLKNMSILIEGGNEKVRSKNIGVNFDQSTEKNFLKTNNGITLVALVVTIIVLLILAGVSINLVAREQRNFRKGAKSSRCEQYGSN